MKKIFINQEEVNYTEDNFPMLIHGEDHCGASMYAISLIANLFLEGSKIIVLCGYPMAEKQFRDQVGVSKGEITFFTKEYILDFKDKISLISNIDDYIILLKNIELFDEEIFDFVSKHKKYIISGDFNKCIFQDKVLDKGFRTKIFFSKFHGVDVPMLNKYEGYVISDKIKGVTKLEV